MQFRVYFFLYYFKRQETEVWVIFPPVNYVPVEYLWSKYYTSKLTKQFFKKIILYKYYRTSE